MKKLALIFLPQFAVLFVIARVYVTTLLCDNLSNPIAIYHINHINFIRLRNGFNDQPGFLLFNLT